MRETIDPRTLPKWLGDLFERADAYFISEEMRTDSASEIANTRMGLLLALTASLGTIAFLPIEFAIWPFPIAAGTAAVALIIFALPFALRQRRAMQHLGQFVLAVIAIGSTFSLWNSGGQAIGLLPVLPILPVLGLLVSGAAGARRWTAISLAVAGIGAYLVASGASPSAGYQGSGPLDRYPIAAICIVGIGIIAQVFETFWNRTAIEVADRAQAELVAREERSRRLLEHASEGVMIVDAFAVVKFASPAADRLVDVPTGGMVGHRLREFSVHEDFVATFPIWQSVLENPGEVARLQLRTRPGMGKGDPAEARVLDLAVSNQLANPAVEGVVVRLRDQTELAHAEANYQSLVDHSLQGISVECDGKFVYANEALCTLLGIDHEQLTTMSREVSWVHVDDQESLRATHGNLDPTELELRVKGHDGKWKWIHTRSAPASWQGRPARQVAYADITAQKELAERQERERERLSAAIEERTKALEASQRRVREQERMATVGTLAAGIAHQINNPVGAILASADFAILTSDEEDATEIRANALEEIRAQAIRCGKIVRSVLQFSRAEPTEKWSSDLSSVIRTAVDVTTRYANERSAQIRLDIAPGVGNQTTLMNPIELEQVFVNLIRNAVESQPGGATVEISMHLTDTAETEVIVADDGPGISEVDAGKIFDPFYTTRLRDGGTGLGLSVAHGIVVDHGGRMWLESSGNHPSDLEGAHFHVVLPSEKNETRA